MAGIYIHIPFCRKKCNYCDFHFSTVLKRQEDMVLAIVKELELRKDYITDKIETIYLGGGTPSILSNQEIEIIFNKIYQIYDVSGKVEITLEANPDDLSIEKIYFLKDTPVNRLSIGVQSFFDDDLLYMNRAHNAKEAINSIYNIKKAGFDNVTIDLIYGVPGSNNWLTNLNMFKELEIPHLSSYALTVEDKTVLQYLIKTKKSKPVDESQQNKEYNQLIEFCRSNDYEQYEVSNFTKDTKYSIHNTNYWKSKPYIGIGPSAHSFNNVSRQWNVANNSKYISSINEGIIPSDIEKLSLKDQFNEIVMIGLRTKWGIDLKLVSSLGDKFLKYLFKVSENYLLDNRLTIKNNSLILNPKYRFFTDGIASSLFFIE